MKKSIKKLIAVAGAVAMLGCSMGALAACGDKGEKHPGVNMDTYATDSDMLYNAALGDFKTAYEAALDPDNTIGERYALMAVAEAKMLESGVFMPLQTQGGRYAFSRAVPHSGTNVLWGNDQDKLHYVTATTNPITSTDRAALNAKWNAAADANTYLTEAKAYLAEKGYTLKDTYNTSFTSDPTTWDVLATDKQPNAVHMVQTYDGLVEYDVKGVMQPAMATNIPTAVAGTAATETEEGTVKFTFNIRTGQQWVNNAGTKVADFKASDFATGFQHMLDAEGGLQWLVDGTIKGAHEYLEQAREAKDFSVVGVKADDTASTVTYEVYEHAASYFLTMLGYSIFAPMSKTYYESKGGKLGAEYDATAESYAYGKNKDSIAFCGPYRITNFTSKTKVEYEKNDSWWNSAGENARNVDKIVMTYSGGMKAADVYNEVKKTDGTNAFDGCNFTTATLVNAKADKYGNDSGTIFDTYSYVTSTTATTFNGFLNINRVAFANENDSSKMVSPQSVDDAKRTKQAMNNKNFRLAVISAFDRKAYGAVFSGEDLALNAIRNSYTPGNFVMLPAETTIKMNNFDRTYPAGTYYGQIMQDQLKLDNSHIVVWQMNEGLGEMSSDGFDGWYNVTQAKAYLNKAVAELGAAGLKIDADNPIQIDYPHSTSDEGYIARANVVKQTLETNLEGKVQINLVAGTDEEWQAATFDPGAGYGMNYDFQDMSGWGPDYGDPSSYLDTLIGQTNTMMKYVGIY